MAAAAVVGRPDERAGIARGLRRASARPQRQPAAALSACLQALGDPVARPAPVAAGPVAADPSRQGRQAIAAHLGAQPRHLVPTPAFSFYPRSFHDPRDRFLPHHRRCIV
ncbi:MAG: hypothetical protein IPH41_02180 [Sulfuritalea sp.]|nr:hypothetical protein [Sulfuritalea sp.]